MADPFTLAAAGIGSSLLGGITSAFGAAQQGSAQSAMYGYQSAVAGINANIAKQNAAYATYAGEVQAQQEGMKTRAEIGETRAARGASGLDVSTGSGAAVVQSEKEIGAENVALVRTDAAKRAYGYEVEATQATAQGQVYSMAQANVQAATPINVASSLLSAGGSVASKWLKAGQQGISGFNIVS